MVQLYQPLFYGSIVLYSDCNEHVFPQNRVLTSSLPDFHGPGRVLVYFLIRCDAFSENGPGGVMPRLRLKTPSTPRLSAFSASFYCAFCLYLCMSFLTYNSYSQSLTQSVITPKNSSFFFICNPIVPLFLIIT